MHTIVERRRKELVALCIKYNAKRLELFGSASFVEGSDGFINDIDFLIEFLPSSPTEHCEHYFGLLEDLESLFGKKIDLVETKAMKNPYFSRRANESRKLLYAAA